MELFCSMVCVNFLYVCFRWTRVTPAVWDLYIPDLHWADPRVWPSPHHVQGARRLQYHRFLHISIHPPLQHNRPVPQLRWRRKVQCNSRLFLCINYVAQLCIISSPELKAQVSFSDHLSSVVCLSVRLSVNFSHFHLLLQNHWANFNQTWHKVSQGEGDSNLFKWRAMSFPKGR